MYLKNIVLKDVGPISSLDYSLPFDASGNPKPLVLVGPNGSGKSIVLSFIVNSLIIVHQRIYTNSEVEDGKVYKYRSPAYIRSGASFYFSDLYLISASLRPSCSRGENSWPTSVRWRYG